MILTLIALGSLIFLKNSLKVTPPVILLLLTLYWVSNTSHMTMLSNQEWINSSLVALTLWITALLYPASLKNFLDRPKLLNQSMISLAILLTITFMTNNLLWFYISFELTLLPTMALIIMWGNQPERLKATFYMIMYTVFLSFSLLTVLFVWYKSFNYMFLSKSYPANFSKLMTTSMLVWLPLIFLPFLVKIPMYSLHLWLPKAHVQAPVAGSMILAAVLLKLGGYGLYRMIYLMSALPALQTTKMYLTPLALLGASITGLICLNQTDLKALIAYSSVAHMGLIVTALMSQSIIGLKASLLIMLSHGFTSSSLFLMVNSLYLKSNSRSSLMNKGNLVVLPSFTLIWLISVATNMSTPPTLNFLGEIMAIPPTLIISPMMAIIMITLTFMTGAYSLYLYTLINHGPPSTTNHLMPSPSNAMKMNATFHLLPLILLPLSMKTLIL